MKAVVMAGGQGTRLRPLTSNQPKPMVPIANKPTVQHILELLSRHGIHEVVLTVAFLPQLIRNHLGDGSSLGMEIKYSVEDKPLGTAGSVKNAQWALDDTFIIISGDALTDFDLTDVVRFHKERGAMVTIALKGVENPLEFGVVIVDEDGRIRRFLEKPGWGQVFSDTVNTGIYVLEPEVLDHIPEGQPYDFSHELFPALFKEGRPLYGRVCEGYWQDIGSLPQFLQANRDALDGKVSLNIPGVCLRGNIWIGQGVNLDSIENVVGPAAIGNYARVDPTALIQPHTVLGNNVVVRAHASVTNSVVGENSYLAAAARVTGAILGNGVDVKEAAVISDGAAIGDRCSIGRNAMIGNNVKIYPFKAIEAGSAIKSSLIWETKGVSSLFGKNGVRGLANVDITPEIAMRLAMSYGTLLRRDSFVTTSRDAHHACRVFKRAVISGLNSTGVNVRDLTVATVAVNRFDLQAGNAGGGIHVQMSLDDPEQLEILFSEPPGVPIDVKRERNIENVYFREDFRRAAYEELGVVVYPPRAIETYLRWLVESLDTAAIRSRQPRLVLDYSHSAPASFFTATLDRLGVEAITLNASTYFRRAFSFNDELPVAAAKVGDVVRAMGADLGVILDPNAEHLYLLDETGTLISGAKLLLMLLSHTCRSAASGSIVVPLNATRQVEALACSDSVTVRRTRIAQAAVMSEAARPNTIFAATADEAYIFPQVLPTPDALCALGKTLEIVSSSSEKLSATAGTYPDVSVAHRVVDCPWEIKGAVMRVMTERLHQGRISLVDGIKVFLEQGDWALILPDADEPLFHVWAESSSWERSEALADRHRSVLEETVGERQAAQG